MMILKVRREAKQLFFQSDLEMTKIEIWSNNWKQWLIFKPREGRRVFGCLDLENWFLYQLFDAALFKNLPDSEIIDTQSKLFVES